MVVSMLCMSFQIIQKNLYKCVDKANPLNSVERYALYNLCGLSEVGLPLTTDRISDYLGTNTIVNHKQDRQIPDLFQQLWAMASYLKQLFWKKGKQNARISFISVSCYGFLCLPVELKYTKKNVGTHPYN